MSLREAAQAAKEKSLDTRKRKFAEHWEDLHAITAAKGESTALIVKATRHRKDGREMITIMRLISTKQYTGPRSAVGVSHDTLSSVILAMLQCEDALGYDGGEVLKEVQHAYEKASRT